MDHLQEAIEALRDVYRDDVSEQEAQTVAQLAIAHALIALVERLDSVATVQGEETNEGTDKMIQELWHALIDVDAIIETEMYKDGFEIKLNTWVQNIMWPLAEKYEAQIEKASGAEPLA